MYKDFNTAIKRVAYLRYTEGVSVRNSLEFKASNSGRSETTNWMETYLGRQKDFVFALAAHIKVDEQ